MRILVTGASGWTGKAVLEVLGKRHELRAFDRPKVEWAREPVDWLGETIQGDIADYDSVRRAVEGVDAIVHMAVASSRSHDLYGTRANPTPGVPFSVNVLGTYNIFEAADQAGIRRIVVLGGASLEHLTRDPPVRVDGTVEWMDQPGLYGITKYLQERIGWFYAITHSCEVLVLRCGFIVDAASGMTKYGKRLDDTDVRNPSSGAWVDRYDVAQACLQALTVPHTGFEILFLVGWHRGDDYFDVKRTRVKLGMDFKFDFREYP